MLKSIRPAARVAITGHSSFIAELAEEDVDGLGGAVVVVLLRDAGFWWANPTVPFFKL